jgi:hypothetical protein
MIWKELYVEQGQAFNRLVKWIGVIVVTVYSVTSIVLAGLVAWGSWFQPETSDWAVNELTMWLGGSWLMAWMIQCALGVRAAAAIASERERGTWDLLLASPLEGRELVLAKFWGSIHGLRAFVAAIVLAWLAGLLCGAVSPGAFAELLGQTMVIGAFMVTIGLAFSLKAKSSASAMTWTIIGWLVSGCAFAVLAGILTAIVMLAWLMLNILLGQLTPAALAGSSGWEAIVYHGLRFTLYGLATFFIGCFILRRFDRLAERRPASEWVQVRTTVPA